MNKITDLIEELLSYGRENLWIDADDINFCRNLLLDIFDQYEKGAETENYRNLDDILEDIIYYAKSQKLITDGEEILFETKVMGTLMPRPSQINSYFEAIVNTEGIDEALDYFYAISKNSNYIRMCDIRKNKKWDYSGSRGDIKVTINLSKPEKDPKEVAKALKAPQNTYPECKLCAENVGYRGHSNWPARQTLRTIPIFLGDGRYHLQYSPYSYFDEHLIVLSEEHKKMIVDANAISKMVEFVELFPRYFVGSNAALPIIGGSILSHDHYQGGLKELPLMKAKAVKSFKHPSFDNTLLEMVDWYNSVIRIKSKSRGEILKVAGYIMDCWEVYNDEQIGLLAKTDAQHNAITPTVRLEGDVYIIDFILRNNRCDKENPFGIYHPSEIYHNIKKESIGIIEVNGLFILPGRLQDECKEIAKYLTGESKLNFKELADVNHPLSKHLGMIMQLTQDYGTDLSMQEAGKAIQNYINVICEKILEDTAIFKEDLFGQKAFLDYVNSMGFVE